MWKKWEEIEFPEDIRFQEDIEFVVESLMLGYRQMVRYGVVIPNYPLDERRLVHNLHRKIPLGTQLRIWFFGQGDPDLIPTVRAWLERVRLYRSLLPRKQGESIRRAGEESSGDDRGGEEYGEEVIDPPPEVSAEDVARLNDARQARAGLRKGPNTRQASSQKSKSESLAQLPRCDICKGLHVVKLCPNVLAKKDGFDAR